ncbi:prepilin peptidase, partial [Xenorhabdus nematophila]|uniref:prepilin peptidase n=1 Tax=Xenorhabdus nematophila TaxID=628 RepID=UPI0032B70D76
MFEFYSLGLVFFMTFPIFSLVVANYYLNNYSIKPNTKVVCGILSVYIFFSPLAMLDCSNNVQQFSVVFLLSYMMMLSIIDGCSGLLPKELTLSLLILGLIFSKLEIGFILLEESVIGALVNFCIWSVIYHVSNYKSLFI